jgi:hypothetical protein
MGYAESFVFLLLTCFCWFGIKYTYFHLCSVLKGFNDGDKIREFLFSLPRFGRDKVCIRLCLHGTAIGTKSNQISFWSVLFIIDVYMRPGQKITQTGLKSIHSLELNRLSSDRDEISAG